MCLEATVMGKLIHLGIKINLIVATRWAQKVVIDLRSRRLGRSIQK
jgi:hypothetical protein